MTTLTASLPLPTHCLVPTALEPIHQRVATDLAASPHAVLLRGAPTEDNHWLLALARALGTLLVTGSVIPGHALEEDAVYSVEARHDGEGVRDGDGTLIVSTTAAEFPCHTDGYANAVSADIVLLLCVRADAVGGATLLAGAADVFAGLTPAERALLRESVFPAHAGQQPIIDGPDDDPRLHFNRVEIDRMRQTRDAALSDAHRAAVERLDALAAAEGSRHAFWLQPGDCLVFDNRRVLHGRTPFPRNSRRLLKRLWVTRDAVRGAGAVA